MSSNHNLNNFLENEKKNKIPPKNEENEKRQRRAQRTADIRTGDTRTGVKGSTVSTTHSFGQQATVAPLFIFKAADQFHGTRQAPSCRRTNIQRHLAPTRDDSSLVDQTSLADRLVGWLFQWKKLLPKCHEANSLFLSGKSLGLRRTTLVTFSDGWPSRSSSAGC